MQPLLLKPITRSCCSYLLVGGQLEQERHQPRQLQPFVIVQHTFCNGLWYVLYLVFAVACLFASGTSREIPMLNQRGGALQEDLMEARDIGRVGIPPWNNTA